MRYVISIVLASTVALGCSEVGQAAPSAKVAALQIGLRANGLYGGAIDGVSGPLTRGAVLRLQRTSGIRPTGRVGHATRCELGKLGKPLLGQRSLTRGRVGWDVSVLEFRLRKYGLARRRIDGRFDAATARALRRFQRAHRLGADGIAGARTFRALARGRPAKVRIAAKPRQARPDRPADGTGVHACRPGGRRVLCDRCGATGSMRPRSPALNGLTLTSVIAPGQRLRIPGRGRVATTTLEARGQAGGSAHPRVAAGESFFSISQRYHVSPWRVARANGLSLMATIVPGQRLTLPPGALRRRRRARTSTATSIRAALDRWSATYGVDAKLARAVAWMESGFQQDVVSSAGAIGVMQLLPETWQFVDEVLLGEVTPRTYDGTSAPGVRLLRWQLDNFDGDVRLALAAYYQGARAVRERGLFDDTKQYVSVILQLYGTV